MEPTSANPPRKRSRRLIVAFVLVLVSTVTWWNWPRGDARFVGRWERKDVGTGLTWEIVLSRNGTGWADTAGDMGTQFSWRVDGNRLILGRDTIISGSRFDHWIVRLLAWITRRVWLTGAMDHEIIQVSANELRLKRIDNATEVIWKRVPE